MSTAILKKTLEGLASSTARRASEVFSDWCACMALSLSNASDFHAPRVAAREAEYMRIVPRYGEGARRFPEMFAQLVDEMEREPRDVLGDLYMEIGSPNERLGQFFTPFALSRISAEMVMGGVVELVGRRGFVSVSEPACGSGGMVIAAAEVMRAKGLNPQQQMPTQALDLSLSAVHMAYVQLTLCGIPAQVIHADTLRMKTASDWPVWSTLMWNTGLWSFRAPFSERPDVGPPLPPTLPPLPPPLPPR